MWKVEVFGVFLVCISPHSDWTQGETDYLSVFSPNAGKYGREKLQIPLIFTQCSKCKDALTVKLIKAFARDTMSSETCVYFSIIDTQLNNRYNICVKSLKHSVSKIRTEWYNLSTLIRSTRKKRKNKKNKKQKQKQKKKTRKKEKYFLKWWVIRVVCFSTSSVCGNDFFFLIHGPAYLPTFV